MTVNDPWPHLPLSSLPSFFPFPPHGTTVAASSFICQYDFHSLLLFLFNASRTISTNNDFLLDTLSSFLSFFLSFIHSFRVVPQPTHTHSTLCSWAAQQLPYCQPHHHTHSLHGSVPTITVTHDTHIASNKQLPTLIRLYRHSIQHCKYYIQGPPQPCIFLFHY